MAQQESSLLQPSKLRWDEETQEYKALMQDAELDPFEVTFLNSRTFQIDTLGNSNLILTDEIVKDLLKLMDLAESSPEYKDAGE